MNGNIDFCESNLWLKNANEWMWINKILFACSKSTKLLNNYTLYDVMPNFVIILLCPKFAEALRRKIFSFFRQCFGCIVYVMGHVNLQLHQCSNEKKKNVFWFKYTRVCVCVCSMIFVNQKNRPSSGCCWQ